MLPLAMGSVIQERIGSCGMVASTSESIRNTSAVIRYQARFGTRPTQDLARSIWRETLEFVRDWRCHRSLTSKPATGSHCYEPNRLRRRARSRTLWIRSDDEGVVSAGPREERRCGKSVDPIGSGNHSCREKTDTENCAQHRGHGGWPQSARRLRINHCRLFA